MSDYVRGMVTIIKWELRQRRWSIFWWIVGITAFISLNISTYPMFKDQAVELEASLSQMPESMRNLFSDTGDFLSPAGFLSSQIFYLMLPLILSVLTIGLGSSLIAREEQRKTLELLIARPISRGRLLVSKAIAGFSIASIVGITIGVISSIEVAFIGFEGVSTLGVFAATLLSLVLALLFGVIAFTFTSMGAFGRGASIAVASLFALGGYIISSLDSTVTWLQTPAKLFPYHYFKPGRLLEGNGIGYAPLVFIVIILVLLFISWIIFRRRDID